MVRGLSAGGRWIRTFGSPEERNGFLAQKARSGPAGRHVCARVPEVANRGKHAGREETIWDHKPDGSARYEEVREWLAYS
jgi:hypothetical protein